MQSAGVPHGDCLRWNPALIGAQVGADLLIALAYFSIQLALAYYALKRPATRYRHILWLSGAFIAACGITHLFHIWVLWHPDYAAESLLKILTALISLATAIVLWPLLPQILKLPRREDIELANEKLRLEIRQREAAEHELRSLNQGLGMRVALRTAELEKLNQDLREEMKRREVSEKRLQNSERQFGAILDNSTAVMYLKRRDGHYLLVNKLFEELFHVSRFTVADKTDHDIFPRDIADCFRQHDQTVLANDQALTLDECVMQDDGLHHYLSIKFPLRDALNQVYGIGGISTDITDRKRTEEKLLLTSQVFDNTQEGIIITNALGEIIEVNNAYSRMTGYPSEELLGQNPRILQSGHHAAEFYETMWQAISSAGHWCGEVWNRRKNGEVYAEWLTISTITGAAGAASHYIGISSDISPLKNHEKQLERIAHYDALTGIPNRLLLAERMSHAIAQTQREHNLLAVCYLDLDGFKPVNDTLGHEAGDRVLVEIAQRLGQGIRSGDTVARLGGDEFVLLLLGLENLEQCTASLNRLLDIIAQPIRVADKTFSLSASIGCTLFPLEKEDPDTLLRHADQAMYSAKQAGKNAFHLYDASHDQRVRAHQESLRRILQGLENGEFRLYYQPKVDMATNIVVGAEALMRWQHPERGLLSPGEFLPVIEHSDLEIQAGEWLLDTVLAEMDAWRRQGLGIEISINIAANHLQSADFVETLRRKLGGYPAFPAGRLQMEILETAALEDIQKVIRIIESCQALGVAFALDDFGTGYSSLAYLRSLPIETIKIDQTFVRGMLTDPGDCAIVEGIIALARSFGRKTVAEGVETAKHFQALLDMGCELGQGFGIARPMPAEELLAWCRNRQ